MCVCVHNTSGSVYNAAGCYGRCVRETVWYAGRRVVVEDANSVDTEEASPRASGTAKIASHTSSGYRGSYITRERSLGLPYWHAIVNGQSGVHTA